MFTQQLNVLLEGLRATLGMNAATAVPSTLPIRKTFIVDATIDFWSSEYRVNDICAFHLSYPPPHVTIIGVSGSAEPGGGLEVRLEVEATPWFGPGLLRRGDGDAVVDAGGMSIGRATLRNVLPIGADPTDRATWQTAWRSIVSARPDPEGIVACPTCDSEFSVHDRRLWTGMRHAICGQKLALEAVDRQAEPLWCVVGNVVADRQAGPGGQERWLGTKHFASGTKVYCYPPLWGDGYERIQVLGRPRNDRGIIKVVIRRSYVTNFRAKLVYSPTLIDRLSGYWDGSTRSKELAESLASQAAGTAQAPRAGNTSR